MNSRHKIFIYSINLKIPVKIYQNFIAKNLSRQKNNLKNIFLEVDECSLGTHECDSNADCLDTAEGYTCRCKIGFSDISANLLTSPGRQCKRSKIGTKIK